MARSMAEGRTEQADEMSDLLAAVAASRDKAAFRRLFQHYAPRVKSYLLRFGDDPSRVDEVVQETFSAVWTKAHLFDASRASAATWIFTIARNRRIDAFRRERRPELDPNDPALVPAPEPDGEESVIVSQQGARVRAAMASLSGEQQEVLRLSFFEEASHSAIAERLGLPIGTVKSRIRLAYEQLRKELEAGSGNAS